MKMRSHPSHLSRQRPPCTSFGGIADLSDLDDHFLLDGYEWRLARAHQTKVTERAFQPTLTTFFSRARNNSGEGSEDSE